jgi:hypothetical protein
LLPLGMAGSANHPGMLLAADASRMVLACQAHSPGGFAALRHAGVKWPCEPPETCPRRRGIADT